MAIDEDKFNDLLRRFATDLGAASRGGEERSW
jgi:hypothetical protein